MDISVAVILQRQPTQNTCDGPRKWNPSDYLILLSTECKPSSSSLMSSPVGHGFRNVARKYSPRRSDSSSVHSSSGSSVSGENVIRRIGTKNNSVSRINKENMPPDCVKSTANKTVSLQLPRRRMTFDKEPTEVAVKFSTELLNMKSAGTTCRRVVPVSIFNSEPSTPKQPLDHPYGSCTSALFCVPLNDAEASNVGKPTQHSQLFELDETLRLCHRAELFDAETRYLLLRLEEWFREKTEQQVEFLPYLFTLSAALARLGQCSHNPAFNNELKFCYRISSTCQALVADESDLCDDVRHANKALTAMLELDKCEQFSMNAMYCSGLPYKVGHGQRLVQYFAKGRPEPVSKQPTVQSGSESSDSGSWLDEYPLHRYAYAGNVNGIQALLKQGYDPNQLDRDHWAPIHYAAWYGQLSAVQTLLNIGNCLVNVRNRNGSTPLHFAVWCGHAYVAELLLSHPQIEIDAKDRDGKTPLDLCENVPKAEWQRMASLLRSAEMTNCPKVQVDLMDGSNVMLNLPNGLESTTAQLFQQLCSELKINLVVAKIFSIWICSESLQLQLKAEYKPVRHMEVWNTKVLKSFSECAENPPAEEPHLVFRRSAHLSVVEEKKLLKEVEHLAGYDIALGLLYHEAQKNYIKGFYPCSDQDVVMLGATILQIIHGNCDEKKDKGYLASERTLAMLVPQSKLESKNANWASKLHREHKQISKMGIRPISNWQQNFLSFCWNLRVYGSAFFDGTVFVNKGSVKGNIRVHVGVNDFGLHLIHFETKAMFKSCPYKVLQWQWTSGRTYLVITVKENPVDTFTLRSPQASLVNILLSKLSATASPGRSPCPGVLSVKP